MAKTTTDDILQEFKDEQESWNVLGPSGKYYTTCFCLALSDIRDTQGVEDEKSTNNFWPAELTLTCGKMSSGHPSLNERILVNCSIKGIKGVEDIKDIENPDGIHNSGWSAIALFPLDKILVPLLEQFEASGRWEAIERTVSGFAFVPRQGALCA